MKESLSSYVRRKFNGDDKTEEVHEMARDYFGGDFPNPQRVGCLPKESLQKLIGEKGLPDEVLRNHFFACSECFNEYQAALRRAKFSEAPSSKAAFQFHFKSVPAGGFITVLIALGGLFWFWQTNSNSPPIAQNNNSADVKVLTNAAAGNAETNSKTPVENQPEIVAQNNSNNVRQNNQTSRAANEKQSSVKEAEPKLLAKNEVEIDLNEPVWRDSANRANNKAVRLDAKETRLRIKLPKENPAGVYEVFIVDEFGKTLTEKKRITVRNRILSADFDLRRAGGKKKRLCFAPIGEIPDCVLVNIVPPR